MKKTWHWILLLVVIGLIAYLIVNRKKIFGSSQADNSAPKQYPSTSPQSASAPTSQILTRIEKNESSKLSLIKYRSDTGEILGSRGLSFDEAVKSVGGDFARVCQGPPKGYGATGYSECSRIR